jgi:hypothetical protein
LESADAPESVRPDELPTVEERVAGILAEYGDRAMTPMAETHGVKLREEALAEPETVEYDVPTGDGDSRRVRDTVSRGALPWIAVVEEFLRDYESYRDKWLRMAKGREGTPEREEFLVSLNNSFAPEYQQKQYARLKAMKRQLIGETADESPTGETFAGAFDEPVTVLFGLTASSTTDDDEPRPPVEHDREIREAWRGSSNSVKRVLRDVLERRLGLDSSEYAWWWQSEPHPGDGAAAAYSHSHPVVVLDAAAVEGDGDAGDVETYRPVVAKHVAECSAATWDAHRIRQEGESAVTVREDGDIEDFAGYVSEYVAVSPDHDLLERSSEYIMWAASQWATTTQKYSKSRTATAAIDADACHQQYADPDARQDVDHGEEVVRSDRQHVEFECACCGSEFGVEQDAETLVEARRVATADGGAVSDAGRTEPPTDGESRSLRSRWQDARRGGAVGEETRERECAHADGAAECPLCCPDGVTVDAEVPVPADATADPAERTVESFERPPSWAPDAIVKRSSGEETPVGTPGGVDYGELVVEGVGSIFDRLGRSLLPEWLEGPEPWESSPVTEREVRSGELPPPELVRKEYAESLAADRRVTAKEWRSDWYARRFERDAECEQDAGGGAEAFDKSQVRQYAESHPAASVVEVMGRLSLPPSAREFVEEVVAE